MAKTQRAKNPRKPRSQKSPRQLVVTLDASNGEIERIEELGSTGKRRAFSDEEFAALAGDNGLEDFCEALEAAYLAGVEDGFDDTQGVDTFAGESGDRAEARESHGEGVLRSGVRRIILRRALRRKIERADAGASHDGVRDAR